MRSLRAATAAVLAIASVAGAASGPALDYTLNCEGCHRADGTGTPGSVPALRDSVARFLAARGGREYLGRVPGVAQAPRDAGAPAAVVNWLPEDFVHAHVPAGVSHFSMVQGGRQ